MRVVAGQAGGRRLQAPRGLRVRPTLDRVRRSVLDILAPWTAGQEWLDLYAGTGAVGIEALSRGAGRAVFVERLPAACRLIARNLQATGLAERAEIRCQDVEASLAALQREGRAFTVIFADPPYRLPASTFERLGVQAVPVLRPGGIVALEHASAQPPWLGPELKAVREARFGQTRVAFYLRSSEASPWR